MHFLRTVLVLLFSFMLIGSQAVSARTSAAAFASEQVCTCCSCEQTECCVSQAPVTPAEPLGSLPANAPFQTQHWMAVVCTLVLHQPEPDSNPLDTSKAFSLSVPAVPLFKQNCTFLI